MVLVPATPDIMPTQPVLIPPSQTPLLISTPLPVCDDSSHNAFNPRFDLIELGDFFCLCGELPGVQHDDVEVEFIDPHTITVRGRSRRSYSFRTPLSRHMGTAKAIEPRDGELLQSYGIVKERTLENKPDGDAPKPLLAEAVNRYWISERGDRNFSRSFTFHVQVNHDDIQAYMINGLLTITIPKSTRM
ncbi:hypothetical protein V496_03328 [Pseudogymnoascus sp. VKM F-4515 (FW-2607)]|nr:hypothetical protein V496_03328 [Pseudogymnoascus sp. VKM F-4515 (FW-2607)]